jgi:hypothetical protein
MSILEKNKIDGIGISKNENKVALMIADHLGWEDELQHLTLLQDKINAYVSFIESEQVYDVFPDLQSIDGFIIDISFKYPPSENCKKLLGVFKTKLKALKIEFKLS